MNITQQHLQRRGVPTVASLIHSELVAEDSKALRVVARFNREASQQEIASTLGKLFEDKLAIVPGSFYKVEHASNDFVVAGFMSVSNPVIKASKAIDFVETASNIFINPRDKTVWEKAGTFLIRKTEDDIEEVASLVRTERNGDNHYAYVKDTFDGIDNSEAIAFYEPHSNQVLVGVRVSDDHVLTKEGLFEIAKSLVCSSRSLHGQDNPYAQAEIAAVQDPATQGYDIDKTINYYEQLFGDDPDFWSAMEKQIRDKAMA